VQKNGFTLSLPSREGKRKEKKRGNDEPIEGKKKKGHGFRWFGVAKTEEAGKKGKSSSFYVTREKKKGEVKHDTAALTHNRKGCARDDSLYYTRKGGKEAHYCRISSDGRKDSSKGSSCRSQSRE